MAIALFWVAMIGVCVFALFGLLFFAGAVNSKAEEEYWSEYYQDTPIVDVRAACSQAEAVEYKEAA